MNVRIAQNKGKFNKHTAYPETFAPSQTRLIFGTHWGVLQPITKKTVHLCHYAHLL